MPEAPEAASQVLPQRRHKGAAAPRGACTRRSRSRRRQVAAAYEQMPSGGDKFWFENEFGAPEPRPFAACQALFTLSSDRLQLTSRANGNTFHVGRFETPSVGTSLVSWPYADAAPLKHSSSSAVLHLSCVSCVFRAAELRAQLAALPPFSSNCSLTFANTSGSAKTLQLDVANAGGNLTRASAAVCIC